MNNNLFNQRYKIIQKLGSQPGRSTYLSEDLSSHKQVVLKLLYFGVDFDWQDLKLFEREAQTLKNLNHPQIPKYIDYFEFQEEGETGFALVQEYIPGKSLETLLKSGRVFEEADVLEIGRSLLSILSYLHSFDPPIIHRDIKPSNIVISNSSAHHIGDIYLVDFGSVQNIAATEGGTITVVGTYGYMPPEQFGGRTTPSSDLYSLGATLIFLVTGLHPSELPERELRVEFRNHCQISPQFADWLEWMTEPIQSKRFKTAQIALESIDNPPPRPVSQQKMVASPAIPAISKPQGSQITVKQKSDSLKIILPPKGIEPVQILCISCAIPLVFHGFNLIDFSLKGSSNSSTSWLLILIGVSAIASILMLLAWGLYRRVNLNIYKDSSSNKAYVNICYELFGFSWQTFTDTRLKEANYKKLIEEFIVGAVDNKNTKYLLKNIINLSDYHQFTVSEKAWVTQEIIKWFANLKRI